MKIDYAKSREEIHFRDVADRECFYYGEGLYMKILKRDLDEYGIDNINAVHVLRGTLTFFEPDEMINPSTKTIYLD